MTAYDELLRDRHIHDGILHELFNMTHPAEARAVIHPDGSIEGGGRARG
jgi:hypothetical protein